MSALPPLLFSLVLVLPVFAAAGPPPALALQDEAPGEEPDASDEVPADPEESTPPDAPTTGPDSPPPAEDLAAPVPPPPMALPPEEAASQAEQAHSSYCADVAGGAEALAAQATSDVGAVWMEVARSWDAHHVPYLLYWRGLLARCLKQSDRAMESLEAFLAEDLSGQGLEGMRRDAQVRLRRLRKDAGVLEVSPAERKGSAAAGVALAVSSAATGALASWQLDHFLVNREKVMVRPHATADLDQLLADGDGYLGATLALGVACVGSLAGSVAAIARSAKPRPGGTQLAATPLPWAVAGPDTLVLGLSWTP